MTSQENRDAVLNWINEVREQYQIGPRLAELPPPAKPYESISEYCPVAKALGTPCGTAMVEFEDGTEVWFPSFVIEFIHDHDRTRLLPA